MKLVHIILLLLISPLLLGAMALDNNLTAATPSQNLNLSTQDFGFAGPLSLGVQYSDELGYLLLAKFTHALSVDNAIAVAADIGRRQYRLNATWAHALSAQQRIKLSIERLAQKLNFSFAAGDTEQWIGQNAIGVGYQYLLNNNSILNDINFSGFYSKASSKDLGMQLFNGNTERDWRRIAGGEDASASVGVDILPWKTMLLGLQLNYDYLAYYKHYESSDISSGLGYSVKLDQLINRYLKLELTASDTEPYQNYVAALWWLVPTKSGLQMQLGLSGSRIIGQHGLSSDTRVGLNLALHWGAGLGAASRLSLGAPTTFNSLDSWAATPAVYMQQVLAVADEKITAVTSPTVLGDGALTYYIYIAPKQALTIQLQKYFSDISSNTNFVVNGLPQPELQYKDGVVSGSFPMNDASKQYALTVTEENNANNNALAKINLIIAVSSPWDPYPTTNPPEIKAEAGQTLNSKLNLLDLFNDPAKNFNSLQIAAVTVPAGVQVAFNAGDKMDSGNVVISGTAPDASADIVLKARNYYNDPGKWSPQTQTVKLIISGGKPYISPPKNVIYTNGQPLPSDPDTIATAEAKGGNLADNPAAINIAPVSVGVDQPLANFGLKQNVVLSADKKSATIGLSANGGSIKQPTYITQHYTISVTNSLDKTTKAEFTLDSRGAPRVTAPDLGDGSVEQGATFTPSAPIDLTQHFQNSSVAGDTMNFSVDSEPKGINAVIAGDNLTEINVANAVAPGKYTIKIHALNNQAAGCGYSKDATFYLTVSAALAPSFGAISNKIYQINKPLSADPDKVVAITAGSGNLADSPAKITVAPEKAGVDEPLADFGLTAKSILAADKKSATVNLTTNGGVVAKATYVTQHYKITAINSRDKQAENSFNLDVRGAPKVTAADLGNGAVGQGGTINPDIDLSQHFQNTSVGTDTMSYSVVNKTEGIKVVIKQNKLAQISASDKVQAGEYLIKVQVKNDQDGLFSANTAQFKLTVTHPIPPHIHSVVNQIHTKSDQLKDVALATIDAGQGTLQQKDITISADSGSNPLSYYGIKYTVDPAKPATTVTVKLSTKNSKGILHRTFVTQHYTITAKNSVSSKTATADFSFDSRGAPKVTVADLGSGSIDQSGGVINANVDLSKHFQNSSVASDKMSYAIDGEPQHMHATIIDNKLATIAVDNGAQTGAYKITVHAKNEAVPQQGFSEDATYIVHVVTQDQLYCPEPKDFKIDNQRPDSCSAIGYNFKAQVGKYKFINRLDNCVQKSNFKKLKFYRSYIDQNGLHCIYANVGYSGAILVNQQPPFIPASATFTQGAPKICGTPYYDKTHPVSVHDCVAKF